MKTWLKENKRHLLAVAVAALLFVLGWWAGRMDAGYQAYAAWRETVMTWPDPEHCALCVKSTRRHALCLIDLFTGAMDELSVYEEDPTCPWETLPMEKQPTGTFQFQPCVGRMAARDTGAHTCTVVLPEETRPIDPTRFCPNCRTLLAGAGLEGYVILDLYDLDNVRAYPVRKGESEVIRDYHVCIAGGQTGLVLRVTGLLR